MSLSLHHIGLVVADVAEAAATYVRRFGYEIKSDVIHDPTQTAYVQFLKLPGDALYLELVAPDGPKSKLAGALGKGGGLNHLCYAADDLEAECHRLRAEGLFPLRAPVPAAAFPGRRIAWFFGRDRVPVELVERGPAGEL
jgi:methylmalonyl-CoA/ethylmalonyl-CoA epimerase